MRPWLTRRGNPGGAITSLSQILGQSDPIGLSDLRQLGQRTHLSENILNRGLGLRFVALCRNKGRSGQG